MLRIVLGVIVGFIVWSIVWVGGEQALGMAWAAYRENSLAVEKAITNGTPLEANAMFAVANLLRSFLTSLIAGYITALVAGEFKRSTLVLGVILLAVGVAVEYMFWNVAPAWYHIVFVIFLIPMTILGGKLRRSD